MLQGRPLNRQPRRIGGVVGEWDIRLVIWGTVYFLVPTRYRECTEVAEVGRSWCWARSSLWSMKSSKVMAGVRQLPGRHCISSKLGDWYMSARKNGRWLLQLGGKSLKGVGDCRNTGQK